MTSTMESSPEAFDVETLEFYRVNARAYAHRRQSPSRALPTFLARLSPGSAILELGCGGGQDSEAMIAAGFDVTPTDGSAEVAAEAEARLGRPVTVLRFDALDLVDRFDGVWADACLLHAPAEALAGILRRVRLALKDGGVFHSSFKAGDGPARDALGRYNNLPSRRLLEAAMREAGPWAAVDIVETPGGSYDGAAYTWLNCTAVKAR
jgi:SAM-dependent methyltransferase